ncbi:hypothetical protein DEO72_LG3g1385 [Vigna unguiculata]|uniref:Uncharacterized protein n=1 Tax=Vigna unguiculata TaxID=3917 RepID=A0A4D6LE51_VIGUN|nr:hypothetical protein DEO72_LG3g1385 [Vigna unguiculata]
MSICMNNGGCWFSRLGETATRPSWLRELPLRRRALVLSESVSRSGKEVSPMRENAQATVPHFSSSRLGKRSSPG